MVAGFTSQAQCETAGASKDCKWDEDRFHDGARGACVCPRTLYQCQDDKKCMWYRDPHNEKYVTIYQIISLSKIELPF